MHIKTKIVCCHTADSKPVQQEVNSTVILPPLVFPGQAVLLRNMHGMRTTTSKVVNVVLTKVFMPNVGAPFGRRKKVFENFEPRMWKPS